MSKFIIAFFLLSSCSIFGQESPKVPLSEALNSIARSEKISIIYLPQNVEGIHVHLPKKNLNIKDKLTFILKGSRLDFEVKDGQILLYKRRKIYGYIEDSSSGERLISASFFIPESQEFSFSNEYGFFTFETINDVVELEISYIGYADTRRTITIEEMDQPINIKLQPDNEIEEIVISDALISKEDLSYFNADKGSDILLYQNQSSSAIGGEPDLFKQ